MNNWYNQKIKQQNEIDQNTKQNITILEQNNEERTEFD